MTDSSRGRRGACDRLCQAEGLTNLGPSPDRLQETGDGAVRDALAQTPRRRPLGEGSHLVLVDARTLGAEYSAPGGDRSGLRPDLCCLTPCRPASASGPCHLLGL